MPSPQILVTLAVVLVAVVSLSAVVVAAWTIWRRSTNSDAPVVRPIAVVAELPTGARPRAPAVDDSAVTEPEVIDRVVRVMTLLFLASVGVVVFVTRAYPDTEVAIQVLIAGAMLAVVFLQDLLPSSALGRARHWLEAIIATVFVAVLTGLTGGLMSPFYVGFFLVVAGASLSRDQTAPVLVAMLAAGAYALVGAVAARPDEISALSLVWLAFNVVTLVLLAYIASTVGREQRRAREAAISLSQFDPLTGLYNRNYFFNVLDREIRRAARTGARFAVLMLDLDDLKPVNDTLGHQQGDELLRSVTDVIRRDIRSTDVAARYGGDEFVVLLSDTDPDGAHIVAEKLRSDIANLAIGAADRPARTSASIGLVSYPDDGTTADALIADVDKAMYESKRRGKNQIVGYMTRTERITTPLGRSRTTIMERPAREQTPPQQPGRRDSYPGEAPRRDSYPGEAPRRDSYPGEAPRRDSNPGEAPRRDAYPPAAGNDPPPRQSARVEPARTDASGTRPAWDSTAPPAPSMAERARQAESRPYVAFPVPRAGQPITDRSEAQSGRYAAGSQPPRDFTDR